MKTLLKVLSKTQFGFVTKEDLDVLEIEMPNLPFLLGAATDMLLKLRMPKLGWTMSKTGDHIRDVSIPSRTLDGMSTFRLFL